MKTYDYWETWTRILSPLKNYSQQEGILALLHDAKVYVTRGHYNTAQSILRYAEYDLRHLKNE